MRGLLLTMCVLMLATLQSCSTESGSHSDGARQNRLLMYMEAVEYQADSVHHVGDAYGQATTLLALCGQGSRLFLYIDRAHCTSCWKKDVEVMHALTDKPECARDMAVMASGFVGRELSIMRQNTGLDIYDAGAGEALPSALRKFSLPFFFVLTQDGKLVLPYYPSNEDDEKFLRNYLALAESRMKEAHASARPRPNSDVRSLQVENENLDMGEVRIRRKASGEFVLKNMGDADCELQQIYPTCSCILIDDYPKVIKAGEAGRARFTTVQTNPGAFHHSIRVQTNLDAEAYSLTFHGTCR